MKLRALLITSLVSALLATGALAQSYPSGSIYTSPPVGTTYGAPSGGSGYSNPNSVYVNPYTTRDGTYVQGHRRSEANDTKLDNWSTQGNTNPYSGKSGTKNPWR